jgi:hypothetical protein
VLVDGVPAPEYASRGRVYVEALRGRDFTIRLHNPGPGRAAAALSVDGRNVLDAARTTARYASKWVLAPGESLDVPGWQISGEVSRRFYFTETSRSYASWLGDTANVGTIEVVFYREKPRCGAAQRPALKDERQRTRDIEERVRQAEGADEANGVEGGVPGGVMGGVPPGDAPTRESGAQDSVRVESKPSAAPAPKSAQPAPPAQAEADRFAATGIGSRTSFSVEWVDFEQAERPAATIALRYEFREQLVRLGVLPREDRGLFAREHARGFEPAYAPDPDGRR